VDNVFKQTVSAYNATRLAQQTVYSISWPTSGSHTIKGVKKSGTYMILDALKIFN
jgi:alpha-galactosidase